MIKVASYCRVSTNKDDQINSFEAQKKFFYEYVDRHTEWKLYKIYADEGITGTSTKKRTQFNAMVDDAYANKFELILTKEVSRFSRNILDTIAYARELKSLGIGVHFLSDGFSTLDPDAELRLSIMGSIAQEESRKISMRVKWGQTRQMEKGIVFGKSMLGYDISHGDITVNLDGAETVRKIFYMYGVEKLGTTTIAKELRKLGLKTYSGNTNWSDSHILKILKNEKYVGDLIQKKTITPDYLTHHKKYNHGEEDMIILQNHHEPIIDRALWNTVQEEIIKRRRIQNSSDAHSNRYVFSGKIICAECGSRFVSRKKTCKSGHSYRRWGCYKACKDGVRKTDIHGNVQGCDIGILLPDAVATDMLSYAVRHLPIDRNSITNNLTKIVLNSIKNVTQNKEPPYILEDKIESIEEKKRRAIDLLLSGVLTEQEFSAMKLHYNREIEKVKNRLNDSMEHNQNVGEHTADHIRNMIASIVNCVDPPDSFSKLLPEYMILHKDRSVELKLQKCSSIWEFQLCKE